MITSLVQSANTTANWNLTNILSQPFNDNTIVWLVVSAGIGGLIAEVAKYIFEQSIPQWRLERSAKIAIQKYYYPLLIAARNLHTIIQEILLSINEGIDYDSDEYQHLKILWYFASFFWVV